ncbi:hypothetical protein F8C76_06680 [Flagellimonas olearia]|uniref:Uncharacterized protein n=1 Tax=Flagellimonas olearia TaxID=552546 RepID=A0A444VQN6_9FLAO|nr:hypothetical protein [Allomuricauda olearia]KAB7531175.1 hypothetical protein F8C76_06680 [Allomuricauda olearia]RYC53145.1 hypothetical protein DN53_02700 [Allomuricauda olearia]
MENLIRLKPNYTNLDALYELLKSSSYECSKEYDTWEHRTDTSGQMAQCIVLKKSGMHAVKLFFVNENTVKINHIIPNKLMNAYFGKSVKARRNILEVIAGVIKQAILVKPQQQAFEELEGEIKNLAA